MKLSVNKPGASNPDPLRLSIVDPDPTSSPLVLDARVTDISDELRGKLISKDVDGEGGLGPSKCSNGIDDDTDADETGGGTDAADDDCEKDLAQMVFNACPTGSDIEVVAAAAPASARSSSRPRTRSSATRCRSPSRARDSIAGVTQDFSFIQRGELFRAQGKIAQLKRSASSQVDERAGAEPVGDDPHRARRSGRVRRRRRSAPTSTRTAGPSSSSPTPSSPRRRPASTSACATRSRPARTSRQNAVVGHLLRHRGAQPARDAERARRSPRPRTSRTSTSASCGSARAAAPAC